MQELPLESIADVQTGFPFRGKIKSAPESDYRVIQGKDIQPDFTFVPEELTRFNVPTRARTENKLLQKGDIIVMTRSDKPYAVRITEDLPLTVVQSSFNTIRSKSTETILSTYLAMILNQNLLRKRLATLLKGTNIPYIRIEDLRKLSIPLPSLERQRQLVALEASFRREQKLHRELETTRQALLDSLILEQIAN